MVLTRPVTRVPERPLRAQNTSTWRAMPLWIKSAAVSRQATNVAPPILMIEE